jgi:uncharacterized PurR-regulated membrane protein YhhQ (DUF165 family)
MRTLIYVDAEQRKVKFTATTQENYSKQDNRNELFINFFFRGHIALLTYLFTELSPSWEATNWAATQEFSSISWNPKV